MYTAGKLEDALTASGVDCLLEDAGKGHTFYTFDSTSMPTDKNIFVPYESLEQARALAAEVAREVEAERSPEAAEEPPGAKRIIGEVLSVVGFLVLVMLAVYGADGLANWLKGLLGIG